MVSHKHKFVFLHLLRTAGTSIEKTLSHLCEISPHTPNSEIGYDKHPTIDQIKNTIGESKFNEYFKFTFVRNPWDKLVSLYFWGLQIGDLKQSDRDAWKKSGFKSWLINIYPTFKFKEKVGWGNYNPCLYIDNNMSMNFIGRFENLNNDWNAICQRIGINIKLEHTYSTKRVHYTKYYDKESIEFVRNIMSEDIKAFGYEFGK